MSEPLHNAADVPAKHLGLRIGTKESSAEAGKPLTLVVDVKPEPKIHVYAPGQEGYIPISLSLAQQPAFIKVPMKFPEAESFFFAPTTETFKVYSKPFRLVQELTLSATSESLRRLTGREPLTISGTLGYQACDDAVCYRPESVSLRWNVPVIR